MNTIVVHEFGGPEVLKREEVPAPTPAAGQVLVRVHAVGVIPYDTVMRNGTYTVKPPLPYTPGSDGAGVIGNKFMGPAAQTRSENVLRRKNGNERYRLFHQPNAKQ